MVISFEEKDRVAIESTGMMIIQYKQLLYKRAEYAAKGFVTLVDFSERITEAWERFTNRFCEAVEDVKLLIQKIFDHYHYPTSRGYKIVKFISKCTGIDIYKLWKGTRRTWLARSRI